MKTSALLLLLVTSPVLAQSCPPGIPSANNPGCIPPDDPLSPYYSGGGSEIPAPPPQPIGEWIKTWGAIAEDEDSKGGVSVGKLSKKEAEEEAVKNCLAVGGGACKPVLAYRNQCVAYAEGQRHDGLFGGERTRSESIEHSSQLALKNCAAQGLQNCKIIYSACTEPVFRRY